MEMEQKEKRGLLKFFIDAIVSPKAAVEEFVEQASFWPMGFLLMLVNLLLFLPIIPKMREFTLWTLEHSPKPMPPEQLAMTKQMLPAITGAQAALAFVSPLIMWVILALLLKFLNLVVAGDGTFKKLMSAAVIASVPNVLGGIVKTILVLLTPASNMKNVTTSLALFLPKNQTGFLFGFLSVFDPFIIWSIILLAMGAAVAIRTTTRKAGVFLGIILAVYGVIMGAAAHFGGGAV